MKNPLLTILVLSLMSWITSESYAQRMMENLDRGIVAVKTLDGVFLSWRLRSNERSAAFNIYKNGKKWKSVSTKSPTNLIDPSGSLQDVYYITAVIDGKEVSSSYATQAQPTDYFEIELDRPLGGRTAPTLDLSKEAIAQRRDGIENQEGLPYKYFPGEGACADLDGDGEYEIIVKWESDQDKDNGKVGMTPPCIIDAYKMDGTKLWRINLGQNIRSGAHYTQILAYDFDCDGKAEVVLRTAPGTIDGLKNPVLMGDDKVTDDYRVTLEQKRGRVGFMNTGPEYLTVFRGSDGSQICSAPFSPERGDVNTWGDDYGNRADRLLACTAYLDGIHPYIIQARGYYMKSAITAWKFDGKQLIRQWQVVSPVKDSWFDMQGIQHKGKSIYAAGNHNISVGDVDGDGKDEIVHGACAIDDNGTVMYNTQLGHGDAMHLGDLDPSHPGLEVMVVHEEKEIYPLAGMEMHDARTGKILWQIPATNDNGKGISADIDPTHKGKESWSYFTDGIYDCHGKMICKDKPRHMTFRVYWDGDLLDELYQGDNIYKWNSDCHRLEICHKMPGTEQANGTKQTPFLQADLFGDWREELVMRVKGNASRLRVYTTTILTDYRMYTLMDDPTYRMGIAWQNIGYNQPPHLGFSLIDLRKATWPQHSIIRNY